MLGSSRRYLILGLIFPIIAYGSIILAIANAPWFNLMKNALSDLGAYRGSDIIFNTGLIISGFLFLIYSIKLFIENSSVLSKIGFIFLIISAISLSLIGVFPEQFGIIHLFVAIVFFLTFPIGILIISFWMYRDKKESGLFKIGIVVFFGSFATWLFPWKSIGVTGLAIPEIISSLLGIIWIIIYTIKEMKLMESGIGTSQK